MALSLAEAAQATGVNRSTILRAIKNGRMSGTRDDQGAWSVEPVELFRVFPAQAEPEAVPQHAQPDVELRLRAELAEARLSDLKDQLADMKEERDRWRGQAERLALPKPDVPSAKEGISLWRWLRSTG